MMAVGSRGHDVSDLVSPPPAQEPPDSWVSCRPERRIRPVNLQGSNVSFIDLVHDGDPHDVYRLFDFIGPAIWEPFARSADELVNGVASWSAEVDGAARRGQEACEQGRGDYEVKPGD